jgi:hypothetical protein
VTPGGVGQPYQVGPKSRCHVHLLLVHLFGDICCFFQHSNTSPSTSGTRSFININSGNVMCFALILGEMLVA